MHHIEEEKKEDSWRINREDVTFGHKIGEGTWGVVFKAEYYGPVAVKKLKCENPSKEQVP